MSGYRSYRRSAPKAGRWLAVKYAGKCHVCAGVLAVGARAFYDPADKTLTCATIACAGQAGLTRQEWAGSPVSGRWVETLSATRMYHHGGRYEYGRTRDPGGSETH